MAVVRVAVRVLEEVDNEDAVVARRAESPEMEAVDSAVRPRAAAKEVSREVQVVEAVAVEAAAVGRKAAADPVERNMSEPPATASQTGSKVDRQTDMQTSRRENISQK